MRRSTQILYDIAPFALERKIKKLTSSVDDKDKYELANLLRYMPFNKTKPILEKINYIPYLEMFRRGLWGEELNVLPELADYAIEKYPPNIVYLLNEMVKPYHVKQVVDYLRKNPGNQDLKVPIFFFKYDEYIDYLMTIENTGDEEAIDRINNIFRFNKERLGDYINYLKASNVFLVNILPCLKDDCKEYIYSIPEGRDLLYYDIDYYPLFKEEEIEKISDEQLDIIIYQAAAHIKTPSFKINSKRLFYRAIEIGYESTINVDGHGFINYNEITIEEIQKLVNQYGDSITFNLLNIYDASKINESNVDIFLDCYYKTNRLFTRVDNKELFELLFKRKLDIRTYFKIFIPTEEILSKLYSCYNFSDIVNCIKEYHVGNKMLAGLKADPDVLLEKFNKINIDNPEITYEEIIELLFLISELKKQENSADLNQKIDSAIETVKNYFTNNSKNDYSVLIDMMISGARSPFILLSIAPSIDRTKLIKYVTRFGNVFGEDSILDAESIPDTLLNNVNKKHIVEISKLLDNYFQGSYCEKYITSLAFKIYVSLGYERSVSFLSPDPKKNYGQVNHEIIKQMFFLVDLNDTLLEKKGNVYVPVINEKLINMVFGNSNKVVNTPIRNVLGHFAEMQDVFAKEYDKIKNDPNLSRKEMTKKLAEIEDKFTKSKEEIEYFVNSFASVLNNWDIIEEEFYKRDNKSKLKLKINYNTINEILRYVIFSGERIDLDEIVDKPLIDSKVFDYVGIDNQFVEDAETVKSRAQTLSRRMEDITTKKFPKLELKGENYTIRILDARDRNILCAGHRSGCCFRPNGNADNNGSDKSLLAYCTTTEYGGGLEMVDSNGEMVMFSPVLRNGNVLMFHSIETLKMAFNEEQARLLEEFSRKIIEESEKNGDNIDFVTITDLHYTENIKSLGKLPIDKKFRVYDSTGQFESMYNNLEYNHLVLAYKKGVTFKDVSYGEVGYSYKHNQGVMTNTRCVNVSPELVSLVTEIDELKEEIILLANERMLAMGEKNDARSYELLEEIKEKKRVYLAKYGELLKEHRGVDYLKEFKTAIRAMEYVDSNAKISLEDLANYEQLIFNRYFCILFGSDGSVTYLQKDNLPPEVVREFEGIKELYGMISLNDEENQIKM